MPFFGFFRLDHSCTEEGHNATPGVVNGVLHDWPTNTREGDLVANLPSMDFNSLVVKAI